MADKTITTPEQAYEDFMRNEQREYQVTKIDKLKLLRAHLFGLDSASGEADLVDWAICEIGRLTQLAKDRQAERSPEEKGKLKLSDMLND